MMNKTIIVIMLCLNLICVRGCSQSGIKRDIAKNSNYTQALVYINKYYTNEDKKLLIKAKDLLDSTCDNSNQIVNTKISLFFLLKNYSEGIKYLNSISNIHFYKPYQKEMYLNTMAALAENNAAKRQHYYNSAVIHIMKYLVKHKTDNQALADLYYTQIRFTSKTHVLNEIDNAIKTNLYDNNFLSILKETIKGMPDLL